MENFKCSDCNKEYDSLKSLSNHRFQKHGIKPKVTYDEYVLNGDNYKCACGCGEETKFLGVVKGYRDYIRGHASRVNNNWGHNPEAIKKSHETQKKMYESCEITIWNKGLTIDDPRVKDNIDKVMSNPNRGKKISVALTGVEKSEDHKAKLSITAKQRWSNPLEREKQSYRTVNTLIKKNHKNKKTKLEIKFQDILEELGLIEGVDFKYQFKVSTAAFDFLLIKKNILIEVDGDFHHCNPKIYSEPLYPIQIKTINNDIRKNIIAEKKNIQLIRFWENDINNDLISVVNKIKEII